MGKLINDIITVFLILSVWAGARNLTLAMGKKAATAHKQGIISYAKYTKMLSK